MENTLFTRMRKPMVPWLAAALCLIGCRREGEKVTVLAQVDNSALTLEDLRESFPAEFEPLIKREQYLDFIKRWIDDEVIYQQALKSKVDQEPAVGRKLEKLRRKLLIEEFLAREGATEVFEPDEMAMNQYYEMHKEDFRRKTAEIKYAHIRVPALRQAAELRARLTGDNFLAQSAQYSLDPTPESYASLALKPQTELPPCLAEEIAKSRVGTVTPPIACPDGMYFLRIVERQDAGSLIPFNEAKEEIGATLLMERKDRLLEGKITRYKQGMAIAYNLDRVPGMAEAKVEAKAATAAAAASAAPAAVEVNAAPAAVVQQARLPREPDEQPPAPRPRRRKPAVAPPPAAETPAPAPETAGQAIESTPTGRAPDAAPNPPKENSNGAQSEVKP